MSPIYETHTMKLIYSPPSPYARKVLVLAHETGLYDQLEHVQISVAPTVRNEQITAWNPLGKVPLLILDAGEALFDSRVICDYLAQLAGNQGLASLRKKEPQWAIAKTQVLADGILDAALLVRYETTLRPEAKRWDEWVDGQMRKIRGALDYLEHSALVSAGSIDIGSIAAGCALGYLEYRFSDEDWCTNRPNLASFYQEISCRPSMLKTAPAR